MRILLTGANGQLGRELTRRLSGSEYLATDIAEMDITDQENTLRVITLYKPDVVIHGAAYTNVDGAESNPDLAYKINAVGTQNVATACLACNAKMVYVSTDYVFDGTSGRAYNEFDQPNPINVYGRTKLAGEVLAKHILNRVYIIRTSWLYGDGHNFVRTMLKLGRENPEIRVVNDQFGCPTSSRDLAEGLLRLIKTESYGIYHIVNNGTTSWYGFAEKIFELSGNKSVLLLPQSTSEAGRLASRPHYSPLSSIMLELAVGFTPSIWQDALAVYLKEQSQ